MQALSEALSVHPSCFLSKTCSFQITKAVGSVVTAKRDSYALSGNRGRLILRFGGGRSTFTFRSRIIVKEFWVVIKFLFDLRRSVSAHHCYPTKSRTL